MTYGNLAYKYDYMDEEKVREKKQKRIVKNVNIDKKKTGTRKKTARKPKKQEISYFGKVACVVVLAASAIFMIIQFVEVNESQSDLRAAKNQYNFEVSVTSQKNFELEQSIDLSKIEKEATTRLGMRRPEKYQTIYLDVKRDDMTERTADEVESFGNRVAKFFSSMISNIVDFFSI